jgi:hypothetical protein
VGGGGGGDDRFVRVAASARERGAGTMTSQYGCVLTRILHLCHLCHCSPAAYHQVCSPQGTFCQTLPHAPTAAAAAATASRRSSRCGRRPRGRRGRRRTARRRSNTRVKQSTGQPTSFDQLQRGGAAQPAGVGCGADQPRSHRGAAGTHCGADGEEGAGGAAAGEGGRGRNDRGEWAGGKGGRGGDGAPGVCRSVRIRHGMGPGH